MLTRVRQRWNHLERPARRSVFLLGVCAVGWPLSAVATAFGVVPQVFEQVMLFLSWGAPAYTAANMILTASIEARNNGRRCPDCESRADSRPQGSGRSGSADRP